MGKTQTSNEKSMSNEDSRLEAESQPPPAIARTSIQELLDDVVKVVWRRVGVGSEIVVLG
jgi:hypothetical protein